MEDSNSARWPWWLISITVLGIGMYLGTVAIMGGFRANLIAMVFDLLLFFALLYLWLVFFSQFVLPVQTFDERRKILDRLVAYLGGTRGPALFVRDGEVVANPEEFNRRGPGVIWLDTASGAVTRVGASFKSVFGPGVNFTDGNEYITKDDVVDLHIQVQKIGPGEEENPFEATAGNTAEGEAVQARGLKVSGLTRDGIEIIPSVEVVFRLDTGQIRKGDRGSLFGYSRGGEREKADKKAIERAIIGQAVNPNQLSDTNYYQVAWNELPAYLAADLWREYLSKFKLDQLFKAELIPPKREHASDDSVPERDITMLNSPIQPEQRGLVEDTLTGMLRGINSVLKGYTGNSGSNGAAVAEAPPEEDEDSDQAARITALQMINQMIKERLTQARVPILNNEGEVLPGKRQSDEFGLLRERGIRVLDVNIGGLRVLPAVDTHLVSSWTANWLTNAKMEAEQIKIRRGLAAIQAEQAAMWKYSVELSHDLLAQKSKAINLIETARILLMRSRSFLIRNDRAELMANDEREALEEIIQWLETDPE
ncbi:MAG TPA: hypothetical protein VGJ22_04150 [Anaerolineales bacterium]|jgi:hypothetical protein